MTAPLVDVILRAWPGAIVTASGSTDDETAWASIVWRDGVTRPATLADAQAQRATVEAEIAADALAAEQQNEFLDENPDALLRLAEVVARQLVKIKTGIPANVSSAVDWSPLTALVAALTKIRAQS